MMKKSLLQAVKTDNQPDLDSFVNQGDFKGIRSRNHLVKKEKMKRIVVDLPERQHIEIKIFATRHGLSIKQLVMIALEDVMREED